MKDSVSKGLLWNEAAKAGVALGLIPAAYMFLTQLVSGSLSSHAVLAGCINFLLWAAKFGSCIWLMIYFMKKFAATAHADNSGTFKFGTATALCSAVIVAAFSLANTLVINPGLVASQFEAIMNAYGSMLDSNSLQAMDRIEGMMPQLMFFSNLIYCFLFGLILSLILSRNIPPRNILIQMMDEMRRSGRLQDGGQAEEQDGGQTEEQDGNDGGKGSDGPGESDFR